MNRQQRRLFHKKSKLANIFENETFENGEKCYLKVDEILKAHPPDSKNKGYIEFVKSCRGRILTVEYDRGYITPPVRMVCIKEDTSDLKYLFPTIYLKKARKGGTDDNI